MFKNQCSTPDIYKLLHTFLNTLLSSILPKAKAKPKFKKILRYLKQNLVETYREQCLKYSLRARRCEALRMPETATVGHLLQINSLMTEDGTKVGMSFFPKNKSSLRIQSWVCKLKSFHFFEKTCSWLNHFQPGGALTNTSHILLVSELIRETGW